MNQKKVCIDIANYIKHFTHAHFVIDYFQMTGDEENDERESDNEPIEAAESNVS